MNRSALLVVSFSLLAGCAATTGDGTPTAQGEDEVKSRAAAIELSSSNDAQSLPAKLGALLKAFKSDPKLGIVSAIESDSLQMSGTDNRVARSVTCSQSDMELVAPGGGGFMHRTIDTCSLDGFDATRAGGQLPSVFVNANAPASLAEKLVTLLEKGAAKGDLGVKKTGGGRPQCCDIPLTTTYELADANGSLVCSSHTGGFVSIQRVECTYARTIRPNE